MVYAVRLGDGFRRRFDANFHTPQFRKIERMLEKAGAQRLGSIATLSEERADPKKGDDIHFRYIEIGSVSAESGEASAVETPSDEAPSRARMVVREGDIIVSLTRPHRGSIAVIDESLDGAIASTGFAVVTDFAKCGVDRSYFWAYLRTQLARLRYVASNVASLVNDSKCGITGVVKLADPEQLRGHTELYREVYSIEMALREVVSYIFACAYPHNLLDGLSKTGVKRPTNDVLQEGQLIKHGENRFFYILFDKYAVLRNHPKTPILAD